MVKTEYGLPKITCNRRNTAELVCTFIRRQDISKQSNRILIESPDGDLVIQKRLPGLGIGDHC